MCYICMEGEAERRQKDLKKEAAAVLLAAALEGKEKTVIDSLEDNYEGKEGERVDMYREILSTTTITILFLFVIDNF